MNNGEFSSKNDYQSLIEFNEKEKKKVELYYKIIFGCVLGFNITALIFYIIYKVEISNIAKINSSLSQDIEKFDLDNKIMGRETDKYFINLFYNVEVNSDLITDILVSKSEYDQIIQWVNIPSDTKFWLCYKTSFDGEMADHFRRDCTLGNKLIVLITTSNYHRFGAVLTNFNESVEIINDPSAFLFNLDTMKKFPVKDPAKAYVNNQQGFFSFGDEDLFVKEGYNATAVSYSKFPNGNYGSPGDTLKDFIGEEDSNFLIIEMEILNNS